MTPSACDQEPPVVTEHSQYVANFHAPSMPWLWPEGPTAELTGVRRQGSLAAGHMMNLGSRRPGCPAIARPVERPVQVLIGAPIATRAFCFLPRVGMAARQRRRRGRWRSAVFRAHCVQPRAERESTSGRSRLTRFGTRMPPLLEAGVNLRVIQQNLGPGRLETTRVYLHLTTRVRKRPSPGSMN